jgi:UDP-sugar transporter A1/2/3
MHTQKKTHSNTVAPLAIIGGTYTVYSSALHHSNNIHLTPQSLLYLLLLAFNYAIMPRLSKKYIHPQTNKQSVALVEELVKMGLGLGGWIVTAYCHAANKSLLVDHHQLVSHEDANNNIMKSSSSSSIMQSLSSNIVPTVALLSDQLRNYSVRSTLLAAGIPSALYALQGMLTYISYLNLDAVTYNGLTQLKVLSSALCCYIILGQRQSFVQIFSLGILMISTIVFQGSWNDWFGNDDKKKNLIDDVAGETTGGGNKKPKSNGRVYDYNRRLVLGVLPCIGATLLSGLAGAFSQRSLQTNQADGIGHDGKVMHRDAYFYTIEISFLSALCLAFSMAMECVKHGITAKRPRRANDNYKNISDNDNFCTSTTTHFFQHWTFATLLPISARASAGLLTALVHRHLGSVIKGFALVLGLVFSALLQFVIEGDPLKGEQMVGTVLVLLGSWLHFTNGPK